jgi:hypothetical protein
MAVAICGVITFAFARREGFTISARDALFTAPFSIRSMGAFETGTAIALSAIPLYLCFGMVAVLVDRAIRNVPVSAISGWLQVVRNVPAALAAQVIPVGLAALLWSLCVLCVAGFRAIHLAALWIITFIIIAGIPLVVITFWLGFVAAGANISVLVDDVGWRAALLRSWLTSRSHPWRISGRLIGVEVLAGFTSEALNLPFLLAAESVAGRAGGHPSAAAVAIDIAGQCVASGLFVAMTSAETTMFYLEMSR